jgi:prepilin-type N-terminal cleavage/methylation domain-containing protein
MCCNNGQVVGIRFQEQTMSRARKNARGFSLIELVIVVVIIAIIGAIAIPKMSRGASGAADAALIQDLSILRSAVDLYNSEHPTAQLNSSTSVSGLTNALTLYSDSSGNTAASKSGLIIYGPYLKAFPNLPVGTQKNTNTITVGAGPAGTGSFAWYFNGTTFLCNDPTSDTDASGNPYNGY